jgi:pimeloyl-ACP methyl ester carboxylesterase
MARAIGGGTEVRIVPGAGHLAELDEPDAVAAAVLGFMG